MHRHEHEAGAGHIIELCVLTIQVVALSLPMDVCLAIMAVRDDVASPLGVPNSTTWMNQPLACIPCNLLQPAIGSVLGYYYKSNMIST